MTNQSFALGLPEVRIHLAQFLDKAQLAASSAVCKSWKNSFAPFLYFRIHWNNKEQPKNPTLSTIEVNADVVRSLHVNEASPEDVLKVSFMKLTTLHVSATRWGNPLCDYLSHLICRNTGLRAIHINVGEFERPRQLMTALSGCLNLKTASIACLSLDHHDVDRLIQICSRLEEMDFNHVTLPSAWALDKEKRLPAMRALRFGSTIGLPLHHQIAFIQNCPRLKSLRWCIEEEVSFPTLQLCKILSETCPDLAELYFEERVTPAVPDKDLAQIFDSCTMLTHFSVFETLFGSCAFQSLRQHFGNLVCLQVGTSPSMTSLMIQEIMVSCPQLNTFIATYLEARDILGIDEEEEKSKNVDKGHGGSYTRDWTCVGLKELRFQICGLEGRPEWQRLVLKQLARLTKLEWLNVANCAKWGSSVRDGLDLRLGSGLDILSSLKRLESLMFLGLRQEMNEEDVRWVMRAWPRLENIYGNTHFDKARRLQLEAILREGDINLFDCGINDD